MHWKQPITTECLQMDTATRLIFMEIMLHARNEDMEFPQFILHGNKQISYQLKRGQALFLSSAFKKVGFTRTTLSRSINLLSDKKTAFNMTFIRQPFGFIVSVLNYDDLTKMTFNNANEQQSNDNQTAFKQHANNKSVKSVSKLNDNELDLEAQEILNFFNETFNKSLKSFTWKDNFLIWRKIYSLDEIKKAITKLDHPKWFANEKPSLELMFRTKNKNGNCDYISNLLDLEDNLNKTQHKEQTLQYPEFQL